MSGFEAGEHFADEVEVFFLFVVEAKEEIADEIDVAAAGEVGIEVAGGGFLFEGGAEDVAWGHGEGKGHGGKFWDEGRRRGEKRR